MTLEERELGKLVGNTFIRRYLYWSWQALFKLRESEVEKQSLCQIPSKTLHTLIQCTWQAWSVERKPCELSEHKKRHLENYLTTETSYSHFLESHNAERMFSRSWVYTNLQAFEQVSQFQRIGSIWCVYH